MYPEEIAPVGYLSGLFVQIRSIMVDLKGMHLFGHVRLQINYYLIISCNVVVM